MRAVIIILLSLLNLPMIILCWLTNGWLCKFSHIYRNSKFSQGSVSYRSLASRTWLRQYVTRRKNRRGLQELPISLLAFFRFVDQPLMRVKLVPSIKCLRAFLALIRFIPRVASLMIFPVSLRCKHITVAAFDFGQVTLHPMFCQRWGVEEQFWAVLTIWMGATTDVTWA